MPIPIQFSMQLKEWYREGVANNEIIAGTVEYDHTGFYEEGEFYSVTRPAIRYIIDYGTYYALKTSIYILLRKEDEVL